MDSSGNVFVTGGSAYDFATVAYSNSGVPLWTNRYDGPAHHGDEPVAIAVDNSGNVFVTGESATVGDLFTDDYDYATIKYSNSGVPLWTNLYNGSGNYFDSSTAIGVDTSGNVFVTGGSDTANGFYDYATVAYSSSGEPLWTNDYAGPANGQDSATAIAVDNLGNVFVTGSSWNGRDYDYVTIKYSSSVPPPVHLDFQKLNNQLVLSWTNSGFNLQSALALTSTFTNIPGATSPYTNALTAPRQFFRLISN